MGNTLVEKIDKYLDIIQDANNFVEEELPELTKIGDPIFLPYDFTLEVEKALGVTPEIERDTSDKYELIEGKSVKMKWIVEFHRFTYREARFIGMIYVKRINEV